MSLYAPFDGTVVEKQGEEGEIISPTAMSSSLGRTAVVTIADLETDGRRDRHLREPALADRDGPAGGGLRQRDSVEALPGPAAAGDADGRPNPRHGEGQGRDPRSRRQALPRAGRDRPFPPQRDRRTAPMPARRSCSSPSRPCSRRTATTTSGSSARETSCASGRSRSRRPPTTWRGWSRASKHGESVVLNPLKALRDDEVVRIAE